VAEGPLVGETALDEDQIILEHPALDSADTGGVECSPSPLWSASGASPPGGNQGGQKTGRRSHESPITSEESVDVGAVLPAPPSDQ
jgi:hypothetical protein